MATAVAEIDLCHPGHGLTGLGDYSRAMVLVRYGGRPMAQVMLPVVAGCVSLDEVWQAAAHHCGSTLRDAVIEHQLDIRNDPFPVDGRPRTCSIVICTRDRTEDLRRCLASLCPRLPEGAEVIVVDNAPPHDATAKLVASYPVRYVMEPRKGLNSARRRGAAEASGEVVLYTDDDVVICDGWVEAMLTPFSDPEVAAVTGAVLPLEMQTPAQELFEHYGGFHRGFHLRRYSIETMTPLAAARVGAGANMAFRRSVLMSLRPFDAELDGGTHAKSGGDTYAFYRLVATGHTIVFQPDAIIRHRHRRTQQELLNMLHGYSVGTFVYLLRCLLHHGELSAISIGFNYFRKHHIRQIWRGLRDKPDANPLQLTLAELRGCFAAPWAYIKAGRAERAAMEVG